MDKGQLHSGLWRIEQPLERQVEDQDQPISGTKKKVRSGRRRDTLVHLVLASDLSLCESHVESPLKFNVFWGVFQFQRNIRSRRGQGEDFAKLINHRNVY